MSDRPIAHLQGLCERHRAALFVAARVRASDPWTIVDLVSTILSFTALTGDRRFQARVGGDARTMSLILAEIGCPVCFKPDLLPELAALFTQGSKYQYAIAVSRDPARDARWAKYLDLKP